MSLGTRGISSEESIRVQPYQLSRLYPLDHFLLCGFIPERSGNLQLDLGLRISEGFPGVSLFETNGSFVSVVQARGPSRSGLTDPMNAYIGLNLARKGPVQPDNAHLQFKSIFGASRFGFTLPPLEPAQLYETVRNPHVGGTLS